MTQDRITTYEQFWTYYLRAHSDPRTRAAHYAGTSLGLLLLVAAAVLGDWRLLVAAPVAGYACAWIGHVGFEGNKPATFGHPFWSFYSDVRMFALWATGRLEPELRRVRAA